VSQSRVVAPPGPTGGKNFYVVAIGASAGGLESLERLFSSLPADTGMAFVVLQHLSPDFRSLMDELLSRRTRMPIRRAENGMEVMPDTIHLLPPMKEMIIRHGQLLLNDKDPRLGLTLPIDLFFRSLAQDMGQRAVAVVLSGAAAMARGASRRLAKPAAPSSARARHRPVQRHAAQRDADRARQSRAAARGTRHRVDGARTCRRARAATERFGWRRTRR
jgi:chemotaxis response regulator CheB